MPTQLDRALNSKNLFLAFAAGVTAVAAWSIWGGDMFPKQPAPTREPEKGSEEQPAPRCEPEEWSEEDMRQWLDAHGLMAGTSATREELLARVMAGMRAPKT